MNIITLDRYTVYRWAM